MEFPKNDVVAGFAVAVVVSVAVCPNRDEVPVDVAGTVLNIGLAEAVELAVWFPKKPPVVEAGMEKKLPAPVDAAGGGPAGVVDGIVNRDFC